MDVEVIVNYDCVTGEGPLWDPDAGRLCWVDISTGRLFAYDPATNESETLIDGEEMIGGLTLEPDGSLCLFMEAGHVAIWDDGEIVETVVEEIPIERHTRFNDVIADPEGRVYCGNMATAERPGRLYRLDPDGTMRVMVERVGISNGMGFTEDRDRMYYTDSVEKRIDVFDYDRTTGELSNRRPVVDTPDEPGIPDGMTVDDEGYLWGARYDGGYVARYDPETGREVERVDVPAEQVTSVMFGGRDLDELYVTCGGGPDRPDAGEHAGALFRIDPGVRGRAEFRSRLGG